MRQEGRFVVRFNSDVAVVEIEKISSTLRAHVWYSKDELDVISLRNLLTLNLCKTGRILDTDDTSNEEHCFRGLERCCLHEEDHPNKKALTAIIFEQNRQRNDTARLATVCMTLSEIHRDTARLFGIRDAYEAASGNSLASSVFASISSNDSSWQRRRQRTTKGEVRSIAVASCGNLSDDSSLHTAEEADSVFSVDGRKARSSEGTKEPNLLRKMKEMTARARLSAEGQVHEKDTNRHRNSSLSDILPLLDRCHILSDHW